MKGGNDITNFDKYLKNQLKDKHFKAEFDALETQYEIIKQIIAERSSQNLTQKELATRIGIRQSHISRLECGNYNPSIEFLQKIAEGLGKELHIELK